jgi:tetratricopeptide (TPR) repeat protein
MWFQKIRGFSTGIKDFLTDAVESVSLKWSNLESYNMSQVMDYFEIGMHDECYNRLKIILNIWPRNSLARYLIGLLYLFDGNHGKAKKYLGKVRGLKEDYAQKLLAIIDGGKSESIVSSYMEYHDLDSIEDEIRNIVL